MSKTSIIDLDRFAGLIAAQEEGNAVEIRAPDGSPLGLTIVMAGPDSKRQKEGRRKALDALSTGGAHLTMEDLNAEVAAASVLRWAPDVIVAGEKLSCSVENARKLFSAHPFILDQCLPSVVSRSPFVKG